MYILTRSPNLVYEGRSKIVQQLALFLSYAKLSAQTVCIDHIYINCCPPPLVNSWSVLEKQITSTPPPPQLIPGYVCGGLVNCIYITDHL